VCCVCVVCESVCVGGKAGGSRDGLSPPLQLKQSQRGGEQGGNLQDISQLSKCEHAEVEWKIQLAVFEREAVECVSV